MRIKPITVISLPFLLFAVLSLAVSTVKAKDFIFSQYTGISESDRERINEFEDEDKQALYDALNTPKFEAAKVVIVEDDDDIDTIIAKEKDFPHGMILVLMGEEYGIYDDTILHNSFGVIGTISDFYDAEYGKHPTTFNIFRKDLRDRLKAPDPDFNNEGKPVFSFKNKESGFLLNNIKFKKEYKFKYEGHTALIEAESAQNITIKYSTLFSDDHDKLLEVGCDADSEETAINLVSNKFELNQYDSVGIYVSCDRSHLFNNMVKGNHFDLLHKPGSFPLTTTTVNTTPTTDNKTQTNSTNHTVHQTDHKPVFHDAPMSYVAKGKARLSFSESVCNEMYYYFNEDYFEDATVPNHGMGLIDGAKIEKGIFAIKFTGSEAVAYTPCGHKLFYQSGRCPVDGDYSELPGPLDRYLPGKNIYDGSHPQCVNEASLTPTPAANKESNSASGGHSTGEVAGSFFGGWFIGKMMGLGAMYIYMQRKINRITGMSGPTRFSEVKSLSQQSLTTE